MAYKRREPLNRYYKYNNLVFYDDGRERESPWESRIFESELYSDDDPSYPRPWKPVKHITWRHTIWTPKVYERWERYGTPGEFTYSRINRSIDRDPFDPRDAFQAELSGLALKWLKDRPVDWDQVASAAIPSLRNLFNTINFLAELDDIPTILTSLRKNARNVKKHHDLMTAFKKHDTGLMLHDARELLSDAILTSNLGIEPLIRDAEDFITSVSALFDKGHKRAKMIERYIQRIRTGIRATDIVGVIPVDIKVESFRSTGRGCVSWTLKGTLTIRASCLINGTVPSGNPLGRFLDSVGVYPDLHTMWNAVPFSFLLDYFAPIGDVLESEYGSWAWQTSGKMHAGLRVLDAMISYNFKGEYNQIVWHNRTPLQVNNPPTVPVTYPGLGDTHLDVEPQTIKGTYKWYERYKVPEAEIDGRDVVGPHGNVHLPGDNKHYENIGALLLRPFNGIYKSKTLIRKYRRMQYWVDRASKERRLAPIKRLLLIKSRRSRRT